MLTRTGKLTILGLPAVVLVGSQLRALSKSRVTGTGSRWTLGTVTATVVLVAGAVVGGVMIARTVATFTDAAEAPSDTFETGTFST